MWRNTTKGFDFANNWWASLLRSFQTRMMLSRCEMWGRSRSIIFLASLLNADIVPRSSLCLNCEKYFKLNPHLVNFHSYYHLIWVLTLLSFYLVWKMLSRFPLFLLLGSFSEMASSSSRKDKLAPWSIAFPSNSSLSWTILSMEAAWILPDYFKNDINNVFTTYLIFQKSPNWGWIAKFTG